MAELLNKQVNVGMSERTHKALADCASKHNTKPVDICRGLIEAGMRFYEEHGWLTFPVRIEPEAFQRDYIAAAAEGKAQYQAGPGKGGATHPGKPPDNSKRHRGDGPRRAVS